MALPSREEIIAYITKVAQEKGIDPQVMLAIVNGESGFNPAAVGDQGQSFGLAQLYMGGGLGNTYEQQYGKPPSDPNDWQQHINFMADQAVSGGKGWEPWHASTRAGIGPQQGLPGQKPGTPGAPGPRDRGVAATPSPGWNQPQQQPSGNEGILAELQKMMKPQRTIGSELFKMTGIDKGDATTLGGLAFNTLTGRGKKTAEAQAALAKENPYSAVPTETDKLAKKKVAVPMMAATGQQPPAKPTVGSGIFSWLRGLG